MERRRTTPVVPDGGAMNEPTTYEIVIRGHASDRILARLRDDFSIDHRTAPRPRTGRRDP